VRALRRLAGAIAVGFGMVFASRTHDQHWSEPITVEVAEERADDGSPTT
jgi:hypothetical protein